MKNKVIYSFRMEVTLCALASFLLALITVAVIALGTKLVLTEVEENQTKEMEAEWEESLENSFANAYPSSAGTEEAPAMPARPAGIYYEEPEPFVDLWLVGAAFLTLALFILYFFLLTEPFARYFTEVADGIQEVAAGNFEVEFPVRMEDELSVISRNLNKMTDDIKHMMENERNTEQAKNELITSVAHDLRTPLTSIIGYLALVAKKEDLDPEMKQKYVTIAYEKAMRLERLIEDLFSYTKVSFGQITLRKSTVDMVKLTEQLLDEFYPSIQQADLTSTFQANEKQMLLEVDGDLMARAIANLISNAIKYGKDGKVLRVELQRRDRDIKLMVTNYGQMIPEADLAHIFDKFYRVEASRSMDTGGSGLGLAITRNIVRMHGGTVDVRSDYGGTVFTVTLRDDGFKGREG